MRVRVGASGAFEEEHAVPTVSLLCQQSILSHYHEGVFPTSMLIRGDVADIDKLSGLAPCIMSGHFSHAHHFVFNIPTIYDVNNYYYMVPNSMQPDRFIA